MADYNQTTDFAVKDTLPKGDAQKVARGSEIHAEFRAIEDMSKTKVDKPASGQGKVAVVGPVSGGLSIVPGNLDEAEVVDKTSAQTLSGKTITGSTWNGGTIDGATVQNATFSPGQIFISPDFRTSVTMDVAARRSFAAYIGCLPLVSAIAKRNSDWDITSSTWIEVPFDAVSRAGGTNWGEWAASTSQIIVPANARLAKIRARIIISGKANWRLMIGNQNLANGFLDSGTLGSQRVLTIDGLPLQIETTSFGNAKAEEVSILVNVPNQGDIIRFEVDETQSGALVRAGTRIEVDFA